MVGRIRLFGHEADLPGWRMAIVQVLLATADVAITATIFWQLLPHAPGLTWLIFLGVYVASYTAGLAANLPGGIGVFDTAMLLGLEALPAGAGRGRRHRGVPAVLLRDPAVPGRHAVRRQRDRAARRRPAAPRRPVPRRHARWSEPDFAVTAATGAVALCGVLMLCLGVLAPQTAFSWLDPDYADIASQAGQFVPSLIGAGLVVVALGLSQRVNLAWG